MLNVDISVNVKRHFSGAEILRSYQRRRRSENSKKSWERLCDKIKWIIQTIIWQISGSKQIEKGVFSHERCHVDALAFANS